VTDDSRTSDPQNRNPGRSGEEDIDEYLSGRSPVSKHYQMLGDDSPPPELDARILAKAERAATVRSLVKPNKNTRWTLPLAIAATVMLSFSLVMNIMISETEISESVRGISADSPRRRASADEDSLPASAETAAPGRMEREEVAAPREFAELKSERRVVTAVEPPAQDSVARSKAAQNRPMSAAATPADLGDMIEVIRGYLETEIPDRASGATNPMAEAEIPTDQMSVSSSLAAAQKKDQYTTPEGQLVEILALYDSDQSDAADTAIRNFRATFPDHTVSELLSQRGD
jgi:hypothetical protein